MNPHILCCRKRDPQGKYRQAGRNVSATLELLKRHQAAALSALAQST